MLGGLIDAAAAGFALLLATAALAKVSPGGGWAALTERVGGSVARRAVPAAEAGVALLLLVRPAIGLVAAAALLAAFAAAILVLQPGLGGAECGCFGALGRSRIGGRLATRNALLAVLAGLAAWRAGGGALPVPVIALVLTLPGPLLVVGRARERRLAERALPPNGRPRVVVFLSPGCPACNGFAERLPEAVERLTGVEVIAVVGNARSEAERAAFAAQLGPAARTDLVHLYERWQIEGTPFVVALNAAGKTVRREIPDSIDDLAELARSALGNDSPRTSRRAFVLTVAQGAALAFAAVPAVAAVRRYTGPVRRLACGPRESQLKFDNRGVNIYRGSHCNKFADVLEGRGVQDYGGQNHRASPKKPEAAGGYTWATGLEGEDKPGHPAWKDVRAGSCTKAERIERRYRGYCPCNMQEYNDETRCKVECPQGLKCFGIQCQDRFRQVCIEADVDIWVEAKYIAVSVLRWIPPGSASAACRRIAKDYNSDTQQHELHHVKDILDAIDEVNRDHKNQMFRACGETEAEARAKLKEQIAKALDRARKDLYDTDARKTVLTHNRIGRKNPLDCRPCP